MSAPTTARNEPPVRVYARLLRQLHEYIARGQGDSPEAEAVGDQMDEPGYALTQREQERVGGLSEDLYALAEGDVKSAAMSKPDRDRWESEFGAAMGSADWDRALHLLRHPPNDVSPEYVRSTQAMCWGRLGDPETALVFAQAAERISGGKISSETSATK
jgi:hypothetical protein